MCGEVVVIVGLTGYGRGARVPVCAASPAGRLSLKSLGLRPVRASRTPDLLRRDVAGCGDSGRGRRCRRRGVRSTHRNIFWKKSGAPCSHGLFPTKLSDNTRSGRGATCIEGCLGTHPRWGVGLVGGWWAGGSRGRGTRRLPAPVGRNARSSISRAPRHLAARRPTPYSRIVASGAKTQCLTFSTVSKPP